VTADRVKEISIEMSGLLEQQSTMLSSQTRLLEMSETVDEYLRRYERLRQLAEELNR
jgi:hypothetical protein